MVVATWNEYMIQKHLELSGVSVPTSYVGVGQCRVRGVERDIQNSCKILYKAQSKSLDRDKSLFDTVLDKNIDKACNLPVSLLSQFSPCLLLGE